ncbi:MAG: uncharacterized protein KVP18_004433 [Porospora cf. gigantea A]|uniref:uncharacterized protein n=1 Tax=Porospora cf. gigantea A TaxID=2853593 RepID=UPI003559CF9B|nr:MAG: hypothetical protein KVP18_004433 [Porospora cf. gigantea A]
MRSQSEETLSRLRRPPVPHERSLTPNRLDELYYPPAPASIYNIPPLPRGRSPARPPAAWAAVRPGNGYAPPYPVSNYVSAFKEPALFIDPVTMTTQEPSNGSVSSEESLLDVAWAHVDRTALTVKCRFELVNLLECLLRWRFRSRFAAFDEMISKQIRAKEAAYSLAFNQAVADEERIHSDWIRTKERCHRTAEGSAEYTRQCATVDNEFSETLRDRRRMHRELQVAKGHEYRRALRQRQVVLASVLLSCVFRRREQLHRYKSFDMIHNFYMCGVWKRVAEFRSQRSSSEEAAILYCHRRSFRTTIGRKGDVRTLALVLGTSVRCAMSSSFFHLQRGEPRQRSSETDGWLFEDQQNAVLALQSELATANNDRQVLRKAKEESDRLAAAAESKYGNLIREVQLLQTSHDDLRDYCNDLKERWGSGERELGSLRRRVAELESVLQQKELLERQLRESWEDERQRLERETNEVGDERNSWRVRQLEADLQLYEKADRERQEQWNDEIEARTSEWVDLCQKMVLKLEETQAEQSNIRAAALKEAEENAQSRLEELSQETSRLDSELQKSTGIIHSLRSDLECLATERQTSHKSTVTLTNHIAELEDENKRLKSLVKGLALANAVVDTTTVDPASLTVADFGIQRLTAGSLSPQTISREFDELQKTPVAFKDKENFHRRSPSRPPPSRPVVLSPDKKLAHIQALVADMKEKTPPKRSRSALRRHLSKWFSSEESQ